jgi:hypothetical protein
MSPHPPPFMFDEPDEIADPGPDDWTCEADEGEGQCAVVNVVKSRAS